MKTQFAFCISILRLVALAQDLRCATIFIFILILSSCSPTPEPPVQEETSTSTTTYDSTLAKKLGADDYGMKPFVMAFLKAGPNRDLDSAQSAQLQRAHLDNIFRMADEGKLVVAGPFLDTGAIRGIYVFNVSTLAEAEALTSTDPAVKAGSLVMELHPWYGSAALGMINDLHKKVQKKQI